MFVEVTPRTKSGQTYYFAELVEAYREGGKVKHKRILYFGSVDLENAEKLKIIFSKDFDSFTNLNKVDFSSAVPYGSFFLIHSIFERLEMFPLFKKRFVSNDKHITIDTALTCHYDITSSYFEGHQCIISDYGYSRDHRGDREQLVIGLVTTPDGFPIKCNIYSGNTSDKRLCQKLWRKLRIPTRSKSSFLSGIEEC